MYNCIIFICATKTVPKSGCLSVSSFIWTKQYMESYMATTHSIIFLLENDAYSLNTCLAYVLGWTKHPVKSDFSHFETSFMKRQHKSFYAFLIANGIKNIIINKYSKIKITRCHDFSFRILWKLARIIQIKNSSIQSHSFVNKQWIHHAQLMNKIYRTTLYLKCFEGQLFPSLWNTTPKTDAQHQWENIQRSHLINPCLTA